MFLTRSRLLEAARLTFEETDLLFEKIIGMRCRNGRIPRVFPY